jgi:hypothetical protein
MRKYKARLSGQIHTAKIHRFALASLPEHFEIVEDGPADAVLVSGAGTVGGARVGVAADPLLDIDTDAVLIPAMRFAPRLFAEPMVVGARSVSYALYDSVIRLDRAGVDGLRAALLEQLAGLRAITGQALRLTKFARIGDGYLGVGALSQGNAAVALTGVASSHGPKFTLHAVSLDRRLEIGIDDDAIARPTQVQVFSADGVTQAALVHQSSRRLTWLGAHALLSGGGQEVYDGRAWRADLAEVFRTVA